ncbi:Phosphatidylserine decarboxylase [Aspergillus parasiticus SU-1]|uniref:Phosphatidylserine decarboxylase n=1 Tax=Aspergillus parasiticus (strain ATCC 56775 / NRRL 5862 / SRRC 143 / SU-1) TaxID=1403190 RepID=A0A0F0I631_ASPPU|nr:Phosphatidylserine decarboxylase [Aspergillus parasiticus SU-1]
MVDRNLRHVVSFVREVSLDEAKAELPLHPIIQVFQEAVYSSPDLRIFASAMLTEVPGKPPYINDPTGTQQVRDFDHLLRLFNYTMHKAAPQWNIDEYHEAHKVIEEDTNLNPNHWYSFDELFGRSRENGEHWGFKSWDDFFTRNFIDYDKLRPVYAPDDDSWVVSACESKPFALQTNVKAYDTFWLKGQPYSVYEMLDNEEEAEQFVKGTIYQAFLSATSYHRWHSPVNGTIKKVKLINGAMFSDPTITGFMKPDGPDPVAPDRAQGYITNVATRALIFIEAPGLVGLMCVVEVGMADVSTCEVTVDQGDTVSKGQEIGMFHHGGSTHCLLFREGVNLTWVTNAFTGVSSQNVPLRGDLPHVTSTSDTQEVGHRPMEDASRDHSHGYHRGSSFHEFQETRHGGVYGNGYGRGAVW